MECGRTACCTGSIGNWFDENPHRRCWPDCRRGVASSRPYRPNHSSSLIFNGAIGARDSQVICTVTADPPTELQELREVAGLSLAWASEILSFSYNAHAMNSRPA